MSYRQKAMIIGTEWGRSRRGNTNNPEEIMTAREYFRLYSPAIASMVLYFAFVGLALV